MIPLLHALVWQHRLCCASQSSLPVYAYECPLTTWSSLNSAATSVCQRGRWWWDHNGTPEGGPALYNVNSVKISCKGGTRRHRLKGAVRSSPAARFAVVQRVGTGEFDGELAVHFHLPPGSAQSRVRFRGSRRSGSANQAPSNQPVGGARTRPTTTRVMLSPSPLPRRCRVVWPRASPGARREVDGRRFLVGKGQFTADVRAVVVTGARILNHFAQQGASGHGMVFAQDRCHAS